MKKIKLSKIPSNPTFKSDQTHISIVFVRISPEWYALPTEKRLKMTMSHIEQMSPHLKRVARTAISSTGSSKYDHIEILEAESMEPITRALRDFKAGAKAKYMDIVDVVSGVKGIRELVEMK